MVIKVGHISTNLSQGSYCHKLHLAMSEFHGVDSRLICLNSEVKNEKITAFNDKYYNRLYSSLKYRFAHLLKKIMLKNNSKIYHSLNIFDSGIIDDLNDLNVDVWHIHWINGEMLSISDVSRLNAPIVWTMHDAWPILGCGHHVVEGDTIPEIYKERNKKNTTFNLEHILWKKKLKYFTDITFCCPSHYMYEMAIMSKIGNQNEVMLIPNGVDKKIFYNDSFIGKKDSGDIRKIKLLFGLASDKDKVNKGIDILEGLINKLNPDLFEIITFGNGEILINNEINHTRFGFIKSGLELSKLYRKADICIVPSRIESYGLIAAESICCGTPVLARDSSGLRDIVIHQSNGCLASPSVACFYEELMWMVDNLSILNRQCDNSEHILTINESAERYVKIYTNVTRGGV